jgi:hypothetical protein
MCSCSGGSIPKSSTKGSRPQREAATEDSFDSSESIDSYAEPHQPHHQPSDQPEESLSECLASEFSDRVNEIRDDLRDSQLSPGLKNDWHERLQGFALEFALHSLQLENSLMAGVAIKSLAAKVESFHKEVKTVRQESLTKGDIWNPTGAMDLDRDLSGLEYKIGKLERFLAGFSSKFR